MNEIMIPLQGCRGVGVFTIEGKKWEFHSKVNFTYQVKCLKRTLTFMLD